jgi:hypothetical protein
VGGSENEGDSTKELAEYLLSIFIAFVARYRGQRTAENRRSRKCAIQEEDQNNHRKESPYQKIIKNLLYLYKNQKEILMK